jgi:two-component system, response regulator YesN
MKECLILIVDDEVNTRNGIRITLEKHFKGYHTIMLAEHGLQALEMMREQVFDLLITDVRMPGMTGIDLLESIHKANRLVPSILLTGFAEFEYAQKALRLGVIDYLLKPIDQDKLIYTVEQGIKQCYERDKVNFYKKIIGEQSKELAFEEIAGTNAVIAKSITYMHENLNEQISIKEVANHVHLSPNYYSTFFKEEMKITFSEYLTKMRHRKGKELLLTTNIDINIIADEIGYQTSSYFIRVFRELEGMTPKQFRDHSKV